MNNTFSLDRVYGEMSCYSLMQVDFKQRCRLSKKIINCKHITHFFDYFRLMYCNMNVQTKTKEIGIVCIFIMIAIVLMLTLVHILSKYFGAVLKIMSVKLHMNEYVAGATLLSFGNAIPDLAVNLMPVREEAPLFTISISNALAVILLSGGMVCFLRPFKINGHFAMRDLLFLMLACEVLTYIVITGKRTTQIEAIVLILLYIFYFVVIIVDLKLTRLTIKSLKKQINELQKNTSTPYRTRLIHEKQLQLLKLEKDNILLIHSQTVTAELYNMQRRAASNFKMKDQSKEMYSTSRIKPSTHVLNIEETRNILHNPSNPRNLFLCTEFWETLVPIDLQDWKIAGWCKRLYLILTSPIVLFCTIFIPIIDYQQPKHGWSKLLNCIQIIITPILLITLTEALFTMNMRDWHVTLCIKNASWSMFLTVPVAIIMLFQTRTDQPPRYHLLFLTLTAVTSLLIVTTCAIELEVLCCIIGLVLNLTENFVASSVRSSAAAIADLIMNAEVAIQGYERMAFAAVLAGPLFSITVCIGIPCYFNKFAQLKGSSYWIYGRHDVLRASFHS
ncbi:mitochondrial sodium/calcium exchanger protein isoform X3 [Drosophila virilis]|uniref:mitochondrial sodium/calcium exchanger protein isoform X3 n=1 Tax=Drosophila virilis TaxID=7244 RepID=UPI001395E45D|nr:mitochondrial sodium/calcium exchanger protein isoform X3 [Drosophila virilis]